MTCLALEGGGPRVVVSTAAFHARIWGSVPGLGGLKETKNVSSPSMCESLLAQFSLYAHKGGLKPDSFHFCLALDLALKFCFPFRE